jgi:protein MpaA
VLAVVAGVAAAFPGRVLTRSEQQRPISVVQVGSPTAQHRVLVVGCIHGNEPAGIAIADRLGQLRVPRGVALWIVANANPDGVESRTRGNADGVDLNRNFPFRWRPLGGMFDSGPHPLSEPESVALAQLVRRVRPTISIWFHQHLDVVDQSGGNASVERRYARLVGLPLIRLTRYPGSAVGWENHLLPGSTAFVVELHAGSLGAAEANRFARSILEVAT